ncbi:IPT/TIG domain-containing protein [Saccharopolyspora hattusasensis]|uniref:IPT/TIG domain-containing protein n=1 Tax=Saccharopolyspora hattusasensis TaxID=1128679 RepID=UPI003D97F899
MDSNRLVVGQPIAGGLVGRMAAPVVTTVVPSLGPTTGGTIVTLTGAMFTGATGVTFGGTPATSFTVNSDSRITATTPARPAGVAQVVVAGPGGVSTGPVYFVYQAPPVPAIASIQPTIGPTSGGTVVTINGTGFTGATAVTFGGTPAASFTVNSSTQITATTPPHAAGPAQVVVTTPGGSSTSSVVFLYTQGQAAPSVTGVSPLSGPAAGGTNVTITGTNFTGATAVTFGGTPAASFTVNSSTQITATTPPHAAGPAQVVVTTSAGSSTESVSFTFIAAPSATGISPLSGPAAGGTNVTITGTNFTGATAVTFGGTPAASFTVNSSTQITATTPPHAAGPAQVVVTTSAGSSTESVSFTFIAAPVITSLTPVQGPQSGGNSVVIQGSGLAGASSVMFGSTPATSFTVNSDNTLTAVAPAGTGNVQVTVTAPGGTSGGLTYSYLAAPVISSLVPPEGPEAGGTQVAINGTGLTFTKVVHFGNSTASFTVLSDNQVIANSPSGTGTVLVTVMSSGGTSSGLAYTYVPPPGG